MEKAKRSSMEIQKGEDKVLRSIGAFLGRPILAPNGIQSSLPSSLVIMFF